MTTPCPICQGTGTVTVCDFDGCVGEPCPRCVSVYDAHRRLLSRAYGTDAERKRLAREARRRAMRPPHRLDYRHSALDS